MKSLLTLVLCVGSGSLFAQRVDLDKAIATKICINPGIEYHFDTINNLLQTTSRLYSPVKVTLANDATKSQIAEVLANCNTSDVYHIDGRNLEFEEVVKKFFPSFSADDQDGNVYYHFADNKSDSVVVDSLY